MPTDVRTSNDFSSGEISKSFEYKTVLPARKNAVAKCRNLIIKSQGGVDKRPGFRKVASLGAGFRKLFSWNRGAEEGYVLATNDSGEWKFFSTEVLPSGEVATTSVEGLSNPQSADDVKVFTFGQVALISDGGIPHQIDVAGSSLVNNYIVLAQDNAVSPPNTRPNNETSWFSPYFNYGTVDLQPSTPDTTNQPGTGNIIERLESAFPYAKTPTEGLNPPFLHQPFTLTNYDTNDSSAIVEVKPLISRITIKRETSTSSNYGTRQTGTIYGGLTQRGRKYRVEGASADTEVVINEIRVSGTTLYWNISGGIPNGIEKFKIEWKNGSNALRTKEVLKSAVGSATTGNVTLTNDEANDWRALAVDNPTDAQKAVIQFIPVTLESVGFDVPISTIRTWRTADGTNDNTQPNQTAEYFGDGQIRLSRTPLTGVQLSTTPTNVTLSNNKGQSITGSITQLAGNANSIRFYIDSTTAMQNAFGTSDITSGNTIWTLSSTEAGPRANTNTLNTTNNGVNITGVSLGGISTTLLITTAGNYPNTKRITAKWSSGGTNYTKQTNGGQNTINLSAAEATAFRAATSVTLRVRTIGFFNPPETKTANFTAVCAERTAANTYRTIYMKGVEAYTLDTANNTLVRAPYKETRRIVAAYLNLALDIGPQTFIKRYSTDVLPLIQAATKTHTKTALQSRLYFGTVKLDIMEFQNPPVRFFETQALMDAELAMIGGTRYGARVQSGKKLEWKKTDAFPKGELVATDLNDDQLQPPYGYYVMVWNEVDGWFRNISARNGRLILAATRNIPNRMWVSVRERGTSFLDKYIVTGANASGTTPADAIKEEEFAFQRTLDTEDEIQNIYSGNSLLVFTDQAEYIITGEYNARLLSRLQSQRYGNFGSSGSIGVVEIDEHTYYHTGETALALFFLSDEQGYKPFNLTSLYNEDIFKTYFDEFIDSQGNRIFEGDIFRDGTTEPAVWNGLQRKRVIRMAGGNLENINSGYVIMFLNEDGDIIVFQTQHKANANEGFFAFSRWFPFHKYTINEASGEPEDFVYDERFNVGNEKRKIIDIATSSRRTFLLDNFGDVWFMDTTITYDELPTFPADGMPGDERVKIPTYLELNPFTSPDLPEQGHTLAKQIKDIRLTFHSFIEKGDTPSTHVELLIPNDPNVVKQRQAIRATPPSKTPILASPLNEDPICYFGSGVRRVDLPTNIANVGEGEQPPKIVVKSNSKYRWGLSRVDATMAVEGNFGGRR